MTVVPSGQYIDHDLFGANFLFHKDAVGTEGSYDDVFEKASAHGSRWPGGTVAEQLFDLTNPDADYAQNLDSGKVESITPLSEFFHWAEKNAVPVSLVIPTRRLMEGLKGAQQPIEDAYEIVYRFVQDVLSGKYGNADISAFEIGNEYSLGGQLNHVEYTKVANVVAIATQAAIDSFSASDAVSPGWAEPSISVQMGIYGAASTEPGWIQNDYIRDNLTDEAAEAIDAVISHYYTRGEFSDFSDQSYYFDRLDDWQKDARFANVEYHVTEWNTLFNNTAETGLAQASSMMWMISEMIVRGVDEAYIWPLQQNTDNDLAGKAGNTELGISGIAFSMYSDLLSGMIFDGRFEWENGKGIDYFAYDADEAIRIMTSRVEESLTWSDLEIPAMFGSSEVIVEITILGSNNDAFDPNGTPTVETLIFAADSSFSLSMDAFEIVGIHMFAPSGQDEMNRKIEQVQVRNLSAGDDVFQNSLDYDGFSFEINGASGNDLIRSGSGSDTIHGGNGADTLDGGKNDDEIHSGEGSDIILGGSGDDTLSGGSGDDLIHGDYGSDLIFGDDGGDTISGGYGNDTIYGGQGDDTIFVDASSDAHRIISGGAGVDTFVFSANEANRDTAFEGEAFFSVVVVCSPNDVSPKIGNYPTSKTEILDFEFGVDRLDISGLGGFEGISAHELTDGGIAVSFGESTIIFHDVGSDILDWLKSDYTPALDFRSSEAVLVLGTEASDFLLGSDRNDEIRAGLGNDTVFGGGGDDIIMGNRHNNELHGGGGSDTIQTGYHTDTVFGGLGDDIIVADISRGGDHLLWGGAGADGFVIEGSSERASNIKILDFEPGIDYLDLSEIEADHDQILFETTGDSVILTLGEDTIELHGDESGILDYFAETFDFVEEEGSLDIKGTPQEDLIVGGTHDDSLFGEGGSDTLTGGKGSDTLGGGDGHDNLSGETGEDEIWGHNGNDQLYGGGEADILGGGAGNDSIWGGSGSDTVWAAAGDDRVWGDSGNDQIHGGDGVDQLSGGTADDKIWGDGHADSIWGESGNDTLDGGWGADYLDGGSDDDVMTGGAGADTFAFLSGKSGDVDIVTDFQDNYDHLMFESTSVDFIGTPEGVLATLDNGAVILIQDWSIQSISDWDYVLV